MRVNMYNLIRFFLCNYKPKINIGNNHYLNKPEFSFFLNASEIEKYLTNLTCKKNKMK